MINWTEEDVRFVMNSMILPCVEEIMKSNSSSNDSYAKMFDMIAKRVRVLDYERQRDKSFFLAFCGQVHNYSQSGMNDAYKAYCEEYDRLNQHLLNEPERRISNA